MIDIIKGDSALAKAHPDYFRHELMDDPIIDDCIIYLGYDDETGDIVSAAAVAPGMDGAVLESIAVSEEHKRQGLGSDLLDYVIIDLAQIYMTIDDAFPRLMVHECLSVDEWNSLDAFLTGLEFEKTESDPMIAVEVAELSGSDLLQKVSDKHFKTNIMRLRDIDTKILNSFGNMLSDRRLYPGIDTSTLDPDMSCFYLEGSTIKGCILMRRIGQNEVINDWVYVDNDAKSNMALIAMLSACSRVAQVVLSPDAKVWFLPVNEASRNMLDKVIPEKSAAYEIRDYEVALSL